MAIFLTADWHLCHQKEFIYQARGFNSPDEMAQTIIANFNSIITPEDDVYVLGDCLLGGSANLDKGLEIMSWFNGRLHLIRGNHDSDIRWSAYKTLPNVVEQETAMFLKYKKYHFYLSHFPSLCSNYDDKGLKHSTINLCGHSHTKDKFADIDKGIIFHCEVDTNSNYPWNIDDIIKQLKEYYKTRPIVEKSEIIPRCSKCVYELVNCGDNDQNGECKTYKRDPPDGGYYS